MEKVYLPDWQATMVFNRTLGEGNRLILFLHGLGGSSADFREIMRSPLLSGYNVVAPDLLGFGSSDRPKGFDYSLEHHAECIVELMDELGHDSVALVGHSMGGSIATRVASLRADRVAALIVAEPNLTEADATYSKRIISYTEEEYAAVFPRLLRELSVKGENDPDLAYWAKTLKLADPRAVHRSAKSLVGTTSDAKFKKNFLTAKLPRFYLRGELSTPTPLIGSLEEAGVNVRVIPESGHAMMESNPAGFADAVSQCLREADF